MPPESERIVERVRKLLALSASSNPNEAARAAEKAVELAQRHNLDLARIDGVAGDLLPRAAPPRGRAAARLDVRDRRAAQHRHLRVPLPVPRPRDRAAGRAR